MAFSIWGLYLPSPPMKSASAWTTPVAIAHPAKVKMIVMTTLKTDKLFPLYNDEKMAEITKMIAYIPTITSGSSILGSFRMSLIVSSGCVNMPVTLSMNCILYLLNFFDLHQRVPVLQCHARRYLIILIANDRVHPEHRPF